MEVQVSLPLKSLLFLPLVPLPVESLHLALPPFVHIELLELLLEEFPEFQLHLVQ